MSVYNQSNTIILIATFVAVSVGFGLDGSNDVFMTAPTGVSNDWKTFEIISGGDDLGDRALEGFDWNAGSFAHWDGLGAYRLDVDILRVFVNHENGAGSTFSRVDLNVPNLQAWIDAGIANNSNGNQVAPANPVVEEVSRGWTDVGSGTDPINNPCTGNVWLADTFGPGLGFADSLYLTAEEIFKTRDGHIWVMDLATRLLYEATDLGSGSWENATVLDTGRTDTIALILSEDAGQSDIGTAPIVLYVGTKVLGSSDFLARNGLKDGKRYYWQTDSINTNGTMTGIFSGGNGTSIAGTWEAESTGAVMFSKSEDVHTNMDKDSVGYGVQVALASQEEAVFLVDCSALQFVPGDLSASERDTSLTVLYAAGTQASSNSFTSMDNLVWSADGNIYVNEDDGEGDIWVIDVDSLLASYASGEATPDINQVYQILDADYVSESSGIIDISEALDYVPGSIFLTTGFSSVTSDNQIVMAVSPAATLKADVFSEWVLSFPTLNTAAKRLATADPDDDGLDNGTEFALGFSPDVAESLPPLELTLTEGATQASFKAPRSLDLVDYYVDYTEDLAAGFMDTYVIKAADVGLDGSVTLTLPQGDRLFARIRASLPLLSRP